MGAVTGGAGLALSNSAKLRALNGKFREGVKSKLGALAGDDDDEDES